MQTSAREPLQLLLRFRTEPVPEFGHVASSSNAVAEVVSALDQIPFAAGPWPRRELDAPDRCGVAPAPQVMSGLMPDNDSSARIPATGSAQVHILQDGYAREDADGERVGSRNQRAKITTSMTGQIQFRHVGGGGGADGLGLSPGGGGVACLLIAAPCGAQYAR